MNILAIGAHPDDIEFGCSGTLIKFAKAGHNVYLLILTSGEGGGNAQTRVEEQKKAAELLGAKKIFWGGFKDTELPVNKEVIETIETVINETKSDIVFLNYPDDTHQDHRALSHSAISATRHTPKVLFFEGPTTCNFEPDIFVNIENELKEKEKLLEIHFSQLDKTKIRNLTIVESAHSCANFRGFQGRVKYAEGFKSLRFLYDIY